GLKLAGSAAGNYALSSTTAFTTANITSKGLTVNFTTASRPYDATTNATILGCTLVDVVDSEPVSCVSSSATAHFGDKNVGNGKAVSVSGISISGADAGNYNLTNTTASTTANITIKSVAITFTAQSPRPYDGTTIAAITGCSLSGDVAADAVSCDRSGASAT